MSGDSDKLGRYGDGVVAAEPESSAENVNWAQLLIRNSPGRLLHVTFKWLMACG